MILAVSGKISSGKDTVGKIIQYLVWKSRVEKGELPLSVYSFSDFARETSFGKNQLGFQIKKFADKLKDIVCLLIGCTREQLEDLEFKNKVLSEEWWVYKVENFNDDERYDIIGSYEDRYELLDNHNFDVEEHNRLYGDLDPKMTEEEFDKDFLVKTTPRLLLQLLGTECGRDIIHPNLWINSLFSEYKIIGMKTKVSKEHIEFLSNIKSDKILPNIFESVYPNWIITDMRFPNELEAVKKKGGITIRVNRVTFRTQETEVGKISVVNQPEVDKLLGYKEHPSERALDNAEFDYTIENNSSIEDLIHTVSLILKREKII